MKRHVAALTVLVAVSLYPRDVAAQAKVDYLLPDIPPYRTIGPRALPAFVPVGSLPAVPAQLAVFNIRPTAEMDQAYVRQLAAAFELTGEPVQSKNGKWAVREVGGEPIEQRALRVFEASGGFAYTWDGPAPSLDQPPRLPSEKAAHEMAVKLLREKGLLPADALTNPDQVHFSTPTLSERSKADGRTLREITTGIDVRFSRTLDGYGVSGPGAKLYVSFGDGGRLVGLTRVWRDVEKAESVLRTISPAQALDLLGQGHGMLDLDSDCARAEVTSMEIVYWMEGPRAAQRTSLPVYRVEGQCVPAGRGSPSEFQAYAPAVLNGPTNR